MNPLRTIKTVTVELAYEDALRLWVLVHAPGDCGESRADPRIQKLISDAIKVTEDSYGEESR